MRPGTIQQRGACRPVGIPVAAILLAACAWSCAPESRPESRPGPESQKDSFSESFSGQAVVAASADPGEPDSPAAGSFTVAATGADRGILEPCGCTKGMLGGIGRRAAFLEAVLPAGCRGIVLATGGLAGGTGPLENLRYETLLMALNEMRYAAAGLGPEELALGMDHLKAAAGIADFPFVLTNVSFPAEPDTPFATSHTLTVEGEWDRSGGSGGTSPRVRIFAVIARSLRDALPDGAIFTPSADAVTSAARSSPDGTFNIVLMRGNREEAKALSKTIPEPWLIVYSELDSEPQIFDFGEREGDARIITPGDRGRFVCLSTVSSSDGEGWSVSDSRFEGLDESLPSSGSVRFAMDVYRQRIRLESVLENMIEQKPHPSSDTYAGTEVCRECHPKTFEVFERSRHARAFKTLIRVKRDYDPGCISCHVTGFGFEKGFRGADSSPHLLGVGCEACHGPARRHAEGGDPPSGRTACETCHDRYHSPGFDRETAWPPIACVEEEK